MAKLCAIQVTFGDCDPAGIVFYPNMFRWMDKGFHTLLSRHGGHAEICKSVDALGFGLASAQADFRRPLRDMDPLDLYLEAMTWSKKSVTLEYAGRVGDTLAFTGTEVRCMFVASDTGIRAGAINALREILEPPT